MKYLLLASLLALGCSQLEEAKKEATTYCVKAKDALAKAKEARDKICSANLDAPQAKELCSNDSLGELESNVQAACGVVDKIK